MPSSFLSGRTLLPLPQNITAILSYLPSARVQTSSVHCLFSNPDAGWLIHVFLCLSSGLIIWYFFLESTTKSIGDWLTLKRWEGRKRTHLASWASKPAPTQTNRSRTVLCYFMRSALNASFGLLRLRRRSRIRTLYFLKNVVITCLRTITLSPPMWSIWIERALLHSQLKFTFQPLSRVTLSRSKSNLYNSRYLVDFLCFA